MLGFFKATIVERPTNPITSGSGHVSRASESDLRDLGCLLAANGDHENRLRRGDLCLVAQANHRPVGVLWLNLETHVDAYLGRWSKPTPIAAYYNQLEVAPEYRRRGIAQSLVSTAIYECAQHGRTILRAAVLSDNSASSRLHEALGFEVTAVIRGARVGAVTIRLPGAGRPE